MLAGIDCGASLVKIAIPKNNGGCYLYSQAEYTLPELSTILKQHGVTDARTIGIAPFPNQFSWLNHVPVHESIHNKANTVRHEIHAQILGLRTLTKLSRNCLVVSIGTGISYTHVGKTITHEPLGSALGGGFALGMAELLQYKSVQHLFSLASKGNHRNVDLEYRNLLVSHFKNVRRNSTKTDIAAGLMNMIAVGVWKDVAALSQERTVVIIGTTLRNNPYLKKLLRKYLSSLNKQVVFVKNGEFASAVGALQSAQH